MSALEVIKLDNIGAEIKGLDLERELEEATIAQVYAAWLEYGVLLFRGAGTSDEAHLRISRALGTLEEHVVKEILIKDKPDLIFLGSQSKNDGRYKGSVTMVDGEERAGFIYFHHDTNYNNTIPKGAVLRMMIVPERGGETVWADTIKAYDALPEALKAKVEELHTVQGVSYGMPERRIWGAQHREIHKAKIAEELKSRRTVRERVLNMVSVHPETGRKSLLISPVDFLRVLELDEEAGDAFYEELVSFAIQPQFLYCHSWQPGDMVAWDNRRTMHYALGYPHGMQRYGQRTTLGAPMSVGRWLEEA